MNKYTIECIKEFFPKNRQFREIHFTLEDVEKYAVKCIKKK